MERPPPPSILIVEDDMHLARAIAMKLELAGMKCQSCGKLTDTFMKLKNQKFDCIVLDLYLEQGSGEKVVEALRADKKLCNFDTPILVMSGYVYTGVIERLGTKISGVFVKPFDSELLVDKIRRVVVTP